MNSQDENPTSQKKPYHSPVIHFYGDIRTITQNTNTGSTLSDGMPGAGMQKT